MATLSKTATLFCALFLICSLALPSFFTLSPYSPTVAQCPSTPLIRSAIGLSAGEEFYRSHRDKVTHRAFQDFVSHQNEQLPLDDGFA